MKYIIPLLLLLASGLGLVWTDDLYQNNNENQLIPKSKELNPDPQSLVLHFLNTQPVRNQLIQLLETTGLDYELIGPKELTGKNTSQEQLYFYQTFPHQILKAKTENSTTYLLFLDPKEKRQYPLLFQKLQKTYTSSQLKLAGLPYLNYAISLKTADIKQFILPILIVLSLILSLFFIRNFYQTIVMFSFPLGP